MFKEICFYNLLCFVVHQDVHYEDMSVLEQQVQAMLETSKSKQHNWLKILKNMTQ